MKKETSNIIFFLSGIVVGATGAVLATKRYFEEKADEEVASVKKAYEKKVEEIEPAVSSLDGDIKGPETIEDAEPGVIKTKASYINSALNNKPPLKDYTKFFNDKGESEHPEDDREMTDEEDAKEQADYETYKLNEDHKKALEENRQPYVIELSDFELTCTHYPKTTLHYYISDDLLVTDDDEIIVPSDVVGDCLVESGFTGNDDDIMYVRNDKLMVDYEIEKLFSPFPG